MDRDGHLLFLAADSGSQQQDMPDSSCGIALDDSVVAMELQNVGQCRNDPLVLLCQFDIMEQRLSRVAVVVVIVVAVGTVVLGQ